MIKDLIREEDIEILEKHIFHMFKRLELNGTCCLSNRILYNKEPIDIQITRVSDSINVWAFYKNSKHIQFNLYNKVVLSNDDKGFYEIYDYFLRNLHIIAFDIIEQETLKRKKHEAIYNYVESLKLKFRFWNAKENKMVYCTELQSELNRKDIMQYIGVKDVKQNEIYDGDIVSVGNMNLSVKWSEFYLSWTFADVMSQMEYTWATIDNYIKMHNLSIEVVGNIYSYMQVVGSVYSGVR